MAVVVPSPPSSYHRLLPRLDPASLRLDLARRGHGVIIVEPRWLGRAAEMERESGTADGEKKSDGEVEGELCQQWGWGRGEGERR